MPQYALNAWSEAALNVPIGVIRKRRGTGDWGQCDRGASAAILGSQRLPSDRSPPRTACFELGAGIPDVPIGVRRERYGPGVRGRVSRSVLASEWSSGFCLGRLAVGTGEHNGVSVWVT